MPTSRERVVYDEPRGRFARPPAFESGAGGLVSTADDMLAFGRMMLGKGLAVLSWLLGHVRLGLGVGVVARQSYIGRGPGCFGWDGACTTSMWIDPREDLVAILMTQHLPSWMDMKVPDVIGDFWTSVYQAIND